MNTHGCLNPQSFYTCSAGDFNGCCSVSPCDTGVCLDEKASNQGENTSFSSESERSSTSTATTGKMNEPLIGTTTATATAAPMSADTGKRKGGSGAMNMHVGAATGTGTTTQPQAGTIWSIPGGISGPSPRPALLGTPSRPDTVTTSAGNSSTSPNTSTSTNLSISTIFPSNATTSSTYPTEQIESATFSSDSRPSTSSSSDNNKALIGGVVGGILVLGVVLAVIFVLFCRCKKKRRRRRRFTLLAWHGPQHGNDREKGDAITVTAAGVGSGESLSGPTNYNHTQSHTQPTPISTTLPATTPNANTHTPTSTTHLLRTPTLISPAPSFTSPSLERRHRHPLSPIPSIPSNPSLHSTLSSKHDMVMNIEQDLGVHPALRGPNVEAERALDTGIVTGTRTDPETTPELGDTGFYRQRAELAAYSQSELINIPHERRRPISIPNPVADSLSPKPSSSSPENPHKPSGGTKIITSDGVLLSANFERFPGCEDYATSFTQCFEWGGVDEKRRESGDGGDLGS